jgi:hypothetical protein
MELQMDADKRRLREMIHSKDSQSYSFSTVFKNRDRAYFFLVSYLKTEDYEDARCLTLIALPLVFPGARTFVKQVLLVYQ